MGLIVGIDLGTTNSVVALKKIGVQILRNAEGDELTPSCLTVLSNFEKNSTSENFNFVVGQPSKDLMKRYPDRSVYSVKRLIGREFDDLEVQDLIANNKLSYSIKTEKSEPGSIKIPLAGRTYSPEDISSIVLKKLLLDAAADAGSPVDAAVVTVPAYFSDHQKFATRAACELAGVRLLRLLPEPTAAAISLGVADDRTSSKTVMVFDLGGGTFDISILNISQGVFMEIAKGGDMWLGGDNIDQLLANFVYSQVELSLNGKTLIELLSLMSPTEQARFKVELKEKCEAAKIQLSSKNEAQIELFGILRNPNGKPLNIDVKINRDQFDILIASTVEKVSKITDQLLREIRFEPELIDTVVMVGGSSLIPMIQEELRKKFGTEKVKIHPRPMTAVAEGAAIMATNLSGTLQETMHMMHSTAHDYFIQLAHGQRHLLVPRNTPLPYTVEQKFKFANEDQKLARLRVFNVVDTVMEVVGELWLHASSHKTNEEIKLVFTVDEDNIISMHASTDMQPRSQISAQIARGGLTAKLYADLERTLSAIIAKCDSETGTIDALQISSVIAAGILETTEAKTGAVHSDKKKTVQRQIANLSTIILQNSAPLARIEFAQKALTSAASVMTDTQINKLKALITDIDAEMMQLEQPERLKSLFDDLQKFWSEAQAASQITHAVFASETIGTRSIVSSIENKIKDLIFAHKSGDKNLISSVSENLDFEIGSYLSFNDAPSRRFDRDIIL